MTARYDLSDEEWRLVAPLLPMPGRGKHGVEDRRVLDGTFYVLRTGAPWRDLPERHGPCTTIDNRFNRCARRGIWLKVFEELAQRSPQSLQLIDSSIARAHQRAASGKRGGRGSRHWPFSWWTEHKIHAVVDQDGLPVRLHITPGQASHKTTAPVLLDALPTGTVVADRGYDSLALVERVAARGGAVHLPTQSRVRLQRSVAPDLYRRRNLIERFFCNLKQFPCIATRFEKHPTNFLAAVALASTRIWLRSIESTS